MGVRMAAMFRRFLIALFCTTSLLAMAATDDLAALKKTGVLKIAVDTTYPPMEYEDDKGQVVGFDVDFAKELAKRLGVKAEFVVMPWDGILAGLAGKRYDVIISSMTITPERSQTVNFVEYVQMGQIFVIKNGGKVVKTASDLAGLVVAVQRDTTSSEAVEEMKKTIAIKDIKMFGAATDAFSALKAGQADAIVIDEPVGNYYVALDAKTFVISGQAMKPEPIGIAVRKADPKIHAELTKVLAAMKKDGAYSRIFKQWFGKEPTKL
jgi:polar amino acid transport system substrate-binding protein